MVTAGNKCWRGRGAAEASRAAGGKVKQSGCCGKQSGSAPTLRTAIPRLGIHTRELKTHVHTRLQQPASLQPRRNHPRPSVGEWYVLARTGCCNKHHEPDTAETADTSSHGGVWTSRIGALAASMSNEDHLPVQRQHLLPTLHRVGGARELLGSFYKGCPHRTGKQPEAPPPSTIPLGLGFHLGIWRDIRTAAYCSAVHRSEGQVRALLQSNVMCPASSWSHWSLPFCQQDGK